MVKLFVRVNGIGHAFSRELGCSCGRCQTINFVMSTPSGQLKPFVGWNDPPSRAHTSASILLPDETNNSIVKSHILIDIGEGVVDSLVCSKLQGLDQVDGLLISHWHPDHLLGINQFCESLKRTIEGKSRAFTKVPLFCTLETYNYLRGKFPYEVEQFLRFNEIIPEMSFKVNRDSPITFTPLGVAHGKGGGLVKSSVIFVADTEDNKKIIFGWDIDVPEAQRPWDGKKNIDVIHENQAILKGADLYFVPANTWEAIGTAHTSFLLACQYIEEIQAKKTFLVHMSGHEDKGNRGYGWSDSDWQAAVSPYGVNIARQGMIAEV